MRTDPRQHGEWTDLLSDYMEGALRPDYHLALEDHLSGCGPCRRALDELRDVVERAGALGPIEPPRDLWSGIAAVIEAPDPASSVSTTRVIAFPGTSEPTPERRATERPSVTLSRAQLVAASVTLIAASSFATWVAGPGLGVRSEQAAAPPTTPAVVSMVADPTLEPPAELAAELAALEGTLAEARGVLDPNTVRVLERNLGVIELAIEDSRRALAMDPENAFLAEHLERVYRRKLTYLRDAARFAEWSD
jgi:hypothetical protein